VSEEILRRQTAIYELIHSKDLAGMVLASAENIQYLTGVTEPSTQTCGKVIFGREGDPVLAVMWLDQEVAQKQAGGISVESYTPTTQATVIASILEKLAANSGTLGMDARSMQVLGNGLEQFMPSIQLVNVSNQVEELRSVKSRDEIESIRQACQLADAGMKVVADSLRPGITELQVAAAAEFEMMRLGSDKLKHSTGVASGYRSTLPHAFASQKKIQSGDIVVVDLGAVYNGYCSDLTRTFMVGKSGDKYQKAYDALLKTQESIVRRLRPGMLIQELQLLPRDIIKEYGYKMVGHMGHNIGLRVEEHPQLVGMMTPDPELVIKENNVLAFFQGSVKQEGILSYGIRLEDTILVTTSGGEFLTNYPREQISVV
jgi:Xaa-Pro aminopeptidase